MPLRCLVVRISVSTVNERFAFSPGPHVHKTQTCGVFALDTSYVLELGSEWRVVYEGSDPPDCDSGIPPAVTTDLYGTGCVAASPLPVRIPCDDLASGLVVAERAPTQCTILHKGASYSEGVNLADLRWSGWGNQVATARGVERGFHIPYSRIPVTIRAFRLVRDPCGGPRRFYTRVTATSSTGTSTVATDDCADR